MRLLSLVSCLALTACNSSSDERAAAEPAAKAVESAVAAVEPPKAEPKAEEPAAAPEAPKGPPGVSFTNVKDGDSIPNGFELVFQVIGKTVKPAGEPIDDKTIGHHHLIIDAKGIEPGTPVPADASHIHFGKGQTKHVLNASPGQHTLTLQFADGAHRSYGPEWAKTITVTVTEPKK